MNRTAMAAILAVLCGGIAPIAFPQSTRAEQAAPASAGHRYVVGVSGMH
jgi:hypothetical protein